MGITNKNIHITVIIDAFRAFATACHILENEPKDYFLTDRCPVVEQLANNAQVPILIGKPEKGSSLTYAIPNSPTRLKELHLKGATVIHRTAAGGSGVVQNWDADLTLAVSFANVAATAKAIKTLAPSKLSIIPMGHEAVTPSLEDELCARFLKATLENRPFSLDPYLEELKEGPGSCFFGENQQEYPKEDFAICLDLNSSPIVIAVENLGEFARLRIMDSV